MKGIYTEGYLYAGEKCVSNVLENVLPAERTFPTIWKTSCGWKNRVQRFGKRHVDEKERFQRFGRHSGDEKNVSNVLENVLPARKYVSNVLDSLLAAKRSFPTFWTAFPVCEPFLNY
jgi:hypothetical protein